MSLSESQKQEFLAALRAACPAGLWSKGVKLAREGLVFSHPGEAFSFRVKAPGRAIAPTVTLYPEDEEWTCDCGGPVDPCEHAAAAAIALSQSGHGAGPVEAVNTMEAVVYRLVKASGKLHVERYLARPDGSREPLTTSIGSLVARHERGPNFSPTQEDLAIDRMIGTRQFGFFPQDRVLDLVRALAGCEHVELNGVPVKASTERVLPIASVEDRREGVLLLLARDPEVTEVVAPGVALCGSTLRPIGEIELSGLNLERLPTERLFSKNQVGELVTRLLPDLKARIPVEVRSKKLPQAQRGARPRIAMDLSNTGHALSVLPMLVYGNPPVARVDGDNLVHISGRLPIREKSLEKELVMRLRDQLNLVPGRRVDFDGEEALRFAAKLRAWEGADDEWGETPELAPIIEIDGDTFDCYFEAEFEDGTVDRRRAQPLSVFQAFRAGLPLVPLVGGGWARLPTGFLEKHGALIFELLSARERNEEKKVPRAMLPVLAELCDELERPRPKEAQQFRALLEGFEGLKDPDLKGVTAELRHYQRTGVAWLSFLRDSQLGGILADDMGLGKTLQTICALRGRTLIVCPRSVVHNWADEIRKFRPSLTISLFHGVRRRLDPSADVTLTTYALMRLDSELLAKEEFDAIVLDEAQAIKNPDSQVARAAFTLRAPFRLALSGTPVENRLDELWSLFHFAVPGLFPGRSDFRTQYADAIESGDSTAHARLRRRLRPFLLRRTKQEVLPELPPRTDSVLYCELDENERTLYTAVKAAAQAEAVAKLDEGASVMAVLEALLRLRQAACHPGLLPGQAAESSSKTERLMEALEDATLDTHKSLVFSQWTSFLDLLEPELEKRGIAFVRLDGKTVDRASVVASFQDPLGPRVMLVSLKAGGTGLNLTAADHVFLLDPWWNPAVENQAADRAHRIGQDKPVMVYRLVSKDTVEEGILKLQDKKRALADAAVAGAEAASALTREDLLGLLQ